MFRSIKVICFVLSFNFCLGSVFAHSFTDETYNQILSSNDNEKNLRYIMAIMLNKKEQWKRMRRTDHKNWGDGVIAGFQRDAIEKILKCKLYNFYPTNNVGDQKDIKQIAEVIFDSCGSNLDCTSQRISFVKEKLTWIRDYTQHWAIGIDAFMNCAYNLDVDLKRHEHYCGKYNPGSCDLYDQLVKRIENGGSICSG